MNKLTIGRKLLVLVALAQLLLLAVGLNGLRAQDELHTTSGHIADSVDAVRESVLSDMLHDALRSDVLDALQAEPDRRAELAAQAAADAAELLDHLNAVAASGVSAEATAAVEAIIPEAKAYGDGAVALVETAVDDPEAAEALLPAFNESFESLEARMPSVADAVVEAKDASIERSENAAGRGTTLMIGAQVIAMGLLAWLALTTRRSILRPIHAVNARLREISSGDGDLTQRLDETIPGEIGQLGAEFNQFTTKLADAMRDIGERATMLAAASEELTAVSTSMRASAQATAQQVDVAFAASQAVNDGVFDVDRSAEELSSAIGDIAANASEAARVATEAVAVATTTGAAVARLADRSSEITSVVESISGIAQQTNLLALNATIEAARAGEAGRGFAVVATEVKDLSDETAGATGDITAQVEAIQADTRLAVDAIERISEVVGRINETQAMIAAAVEQQSATTAEISRTIVRTGESASVIGGAVSDVRNAISAATDGARDNEQAASELAALASDLQQLVGRFRY